MTWTKPDFQEITLNMEVTAYVNTESEPREPRKPAEVSRPADANATASR